MLNVNETITFIKPCYKMRCFTPKIWRYAEYSISCLTLLLRSPEMGTRSLIMVVTSITRFQTFTTLPQTHRKPQ